MSVRISFLSPIKVSNYCFFWLLSNTINGYDAYENDWSKMMLSYSFFPRDKIFLQTFYKFEKSNFAKSKKNPKKKKTIM